MYLVFSRPTAILNKLFLYMLIEFKRLHAWFLKLILNTVSYHDQKQQTFTDAQGNILRFVFRTAGLTGLHRTNVSGYVCNHGSPSGKRDTASPRGRYGNALSVTRSEDTYVKTPPVGRRQPMMSLPACHNISAAGRIHHQLLRLKLASEAWPKA